MEIIGMDERNRYEEESSRRTSRFGTGKRSSSTLQVCPITQEDRSIVPDSSFRARRPQSLIETDPRCFPALRRPRRPFLFEVANVKAQSLIKKGRHHDLKNASHGRAKYLGGDLSLRAIEPRSMNVGRPTRRE